MIGIEDDFTVTGIDDYHNNVNDILRVPFDYCTPSVHVTTETVECTDKNGNPNHLLVMTIPQSSELHANQQDEVYYRMEDIDLDFVAEYCKKIGYQKPAAFFQKGTGAFYPI